MNINRKKRKVWFALLPVIAIAAFFLLSNILSYGVLALFMNVLRMSANQFAKFSYLAEVLVGIILIILFFAVYKVAFLKDMPKEKTATNAKDALRSVAAGFGVSGVSYLWILLAERIPLLSSSLAAMNRANAEMSGGGVMGVILMAVIVAPLLEEVLFRGIVFRSMEKIRAGWIPVLLSAVIFGAYHMNLVQAVYATGMGIVAAVVYAKTRNLLYPILVHLANNLIGAIQSFAPSEAGITAINIFTVVMIIPMFYVICASLKRKGDGETVSDTGA